MQPQAYTVTAWAFCEDCSWTTTAGSVDVAGDGGRHAGTRNHVVRTGGSGAQELVKADSGDFQYREDQR